jgi:PBSX family phage terminase large subunit
MTHPIFSKKQANFYYSDLKDFNLLWGKTGSGKSFCVNLKFYKDICRAKTRKKFLLSGNTQESLYDNVISELLEFDKGIDQLEYVTVANRQRIIVKGTGTRVKCIGANNEKAQDRIQGGNEDEWYADEVVKQPKSFVEMAVSRCRYEKNGVLRTSPIIWTFNPDSPSHYIKLNYFDLILELCGQEIFFDFKDNPLIYDEVTGKWKGDFVEKTSKRFSGVFKERMYHGRWSAAEGVIYDKFDRNEHVIEGYPEKEVKEYVIGIDWGYAKDHPLAILLIAVTDNAYYVVDEIYTEQQLIDESLKQLITDKGWFNLPYYEVDKFKSFVNKHEIKPTYAYADSARPDYITLFTRLTGVSTIGGLKDVDEGIQAVQRKFIKKGNGYYGLYICKKCVNTIREFELYRWDSKVSTGEGKDVPVKKDDHCPDAVRYVVFTRDSGTARRVQDFRRS